MDRPSGTVTFLFTDIEGSTRLWENHPQEMAAALVCHDDLLQGVVESNSGRVFKELGDGVCAVFESAADGVAAALEGQRSLRSHEWGAIGPLRVRMALHTGQALQRRSDFFGPTLNRIARLVAVAHGGQVVLTEATAGLVEGRLPVGASQSDLGVHGLKDLSRPVQVFQLNHPDLPSEFPPLLSLEASLSNLPYRLTEFFGREAEMSSLKELVADRRLVTLTGAGGVGKTSLAHRTAIEIVDRFPDGVWQVELAPLTDPVQIPGAVAGVFGIEAAPGQNLTDLLVRELGSKETLLILDNCEHLIDGAAKLTDTLLRSTRDVRVIATSREPLRIDGEALFRIPSLDLPTPEASVEEVVEAAAVELFTDRAGLVRSGFVLNGDTPLVVEICQQLDGIPLAIELAAARLDTMTVPQIAERLGDRFRLLTRGSRAGLPRQQTLEALIDWSYDLLSGSEQILLRRLGVFGGSFTLEAARDVCGCGPLDPDEVFVSLDRLVETSLVMPPEPDSGRYRMLETIRAYARRHLDNHNETEPTMRQLAAFLIEAGPPTRDGMPTADPMVWWEWQVDEQDNFRSALTWARSTGEGHLGGKLAVEFANYLTNTNLSDEANTWIESALADLPDQPSPLRLRLVSLVAGSETETGDPARARKLIDAMRSDAQTLEDEVTAAWALSLDAQLTYIEGDLQTALNLNMEAADRLQAAGDPRHDTTIGIGFEILNNLGRYDEAEGVIAQADWALGSFYSELRATWMRGIVANFRGDYLRAIELFESAGESAARIGPMELGGTKIQRGLANFATGDYSAAHQLFEEAISLLPKEYANTAAQWKATHGLIELHHQGLQEALPHLQNALDTANRPTQMLDRGAVLTAIAKTALTAGKPEEATILSGSASAAWDLITGYVPPHAVRETHERVAAQLQQTLDAQTLRALTAEGEDLTYEQAAQKAQALINDLTDTRQP